MKNPTEPGYIPRKRSDSTTAVMGDPVTSGKRGAVKRSSGQAVKRSSGQAVKRSIGQ